MNRADSLASLMCRLSRNLGASASGPIQAYTGFALPFSIMVRKDGSDRGSCVVPDAVHLSPQSYSVSSKSTVEAFALRDVRQRNDISVPSARIKQFVV